MIGCFVQVRLDSRRLPGKALLKITDAGVTSIEFLLNRLASLSDLMPVYVLTTTDASEKPLVDLLGRLVSNKIINGFHCGSKSNVRKRFIDASEEYSISKIVRVTGDNPLTSLAAIRKLSAIMINSPTHYLTFDRRYMHEGLNSEIFTSQTLISSVDRFNSENDREHVTPSLRRYSQPLPYLQSGLINSYRYRSIIKRSLTIDTFEEYTNVYKLLNSLTSSKLDRLMNGSLDIYDVFDPLKLPSMISRKDLHVGYN